MRGCSGLTLMQLIMALIVLAVLVIIGFSIYTNYINKAKIIMATNVLDKAGRSILNYQMDNGTYPANIDFTSCLDGQGRNVFSSEICNQLKEDLSSIESYFIIDNNYVLTARARDSKHTILILKEGKIITK